MSQRSNRNIGMSSRYRNVKYDIWVDFVKHRLEIVSYQRIAQTVFLGAATRILFVDIY